MSADGQWGALVRGNGRYDPNTDIAHLRRGEGKCGHCGHQAHFTAAGCACRCPVLLELSPEHVDRVVEIFGGPSLEPSA